MNIDKKFNDFLSDCKRLIAIPSINAPAEDGMPFGEAINDALVEMIDIASEMGYRTFIDPEGYYGYAEIGEGELFGVLCHLDVVPAGDLNNWHFDPFEMTIKDNKIYGRGIQDDKGPTLLSMYALKLLLDEGMELKKRVRFIFGTDEEVLMRCIEQYKQKEEIPKMGFTPDSIFPVTNAEKGLYQLDIFTEENIDFTFHGGEACNSVASMAYIDFDEKIEAALKAKDRDYEMFSGQLKVIGKSVHVKDATDGDNAIIALANILKELDYKSSLLDFIVEKCGDANGELLFGKVEDDISGKLMFNVGIAEFSKVGQRICIDMRIPVTYSREALDKVLNEAKDKYNLTSKEVDYVKPLYIPEDSLLVQSLMEAYQEVTGDYTAKPLASGGATFSRCIDNFVAFGADLPTSKTTAHQADECVDTGDYKKAMEVYIKAFELLVF